MARCGNKDCRKKYDKSNGFSSFENWCSDACEAIIKQEKYAALHEKAEKKNSLKLKTTSTQKTRKPLMSKSHLKSSKPLKAKTPLKSGAKINAPIKMKAGVGLKGVALGSAQQKKEKKERSRKAKIKAPSIQSVTINGLTIKTAKEKVKRVVHEYIRYRDFGKPCPCCNKELGDDYQAGHFLESGSNSLIRYEEDNIHGQRADCNLMNNGDSGDYKINLIKRIGVERVDRLIRMSKSKKTIKRTLEDYIRIIDEFTEKLRALKADASYQESFYYNAEMNMNMKLSNDV